ncbi:MAG: hypothetical protein KBF88_05800 [Polyangiaceae bacterium]|nr:hypothetical protein [Polyangiaceae bacterium]
MKPRHIAPGKVWFVTRRTTRRHFLFAPDREGKILDMYWYVTALIAQRFGIEVHAVQVLSTHIHEVLTDTQGMLPRFLEQRNRLLANVLKCFRGWPEEVFSREGANCVELTSPEAIEKQIVYTLANCVEAGLVETPNEWPGVRVLVEDIGCKTFAASRPTQYFTQNMPAEAALKISFPQALLEKYGSLARSREALARALRTRITSAKQAMISAGRSFKGVARVLCARFTSRSSTFEPFGARVPSFSAAGNKEAARLAVAARRMFLDSYRSAFEAFRQGDRTAQFPYGTWRMQFVAGTRVATA